MNSNVSPVQSLTMSVKPTPGQGGKGSVVRPADGARLAALASLLLGALFALGCDNRPVSVGTPSSSSSSPPLGAGGSGGGAPATFTINTDAGTASGNGGTSASASGPAPTEDANCGIQTSATTRQPTDVLLVLDRSGSMEFSIAEDCCCVASCPNSTGMQMCAGTTSCPERWPALSSGINATITQAASGINWGLKLFPSEQQQQTRGRQNDTGCGVSTGADVPITSTSASAVETAIAAVTPDGGTPTAAAITAATAYLKTLTDQNSRAILLATDGDPNCAAGASDSNASDVTGTTAAIAAALSAGFKVYVIGIGPDVGNLDDFAQAGGTGQYYPAGSATDLASALATIGKAVASCTFTMAQTPPNPDNVAVYIDGNLVSQDATNGWSFGSSSQTVVLNGTACAQITSGAASEVQVLFGCGGAPPQQIP